MTVPSVTMDTARPTSFHYRIAVFSAGGMLIDGYILGVLTIALPLLPASFGMTPLWEGLVGSSALIGLFLGALTLGPLADRIGRKKLYTLDLVLFLVASVAQFFLQDAMQLFLVRLVAGLAIGADYAVSPTYLAEFLPTKLRGPLLSSLAAIWRIGFLAAVVVGFLLQDAGPDAWRWILASSAVPCAIIAALRIGVPESPRWLVQQGRHDEAGAIVRKHISPDATIDDIVATAGLQQRRESRPLRTLLGRTWRGRTFFAGFFWIAQSTPQTAIFTFLPTVFLSLGVEGGGATVLQNVFFALGGLAGMVVINRIGRRRLLISTFWLMALSVTALAVLPKPGATIVIVCLSLYAFIEAVAGNLQFVYPSELFPTSLRGAGTGMAAALSRIGAAFGTFVFPILLSSLGIRAVMIGTVAFLVLGALVSHRMAPETGQHGLTEEAGAPGAVGSDDAARTASPQHS
ncbi:MFS transporter [Streptomyces sp. BH055]|uniref:MFS transporter n=1 Tax=Streptomyces sp. BH055 TaxID=3401173 RepID=UPI003BB6842D